MYQPFLVLRQQIDGVGLWTASKVTEYRHIYIVSYMGNLSCLPFWYWTFLDVDLSSLYPFFLNLFHSIIGLSGVFLFSHRSSNLFLIRRNRHTFSYFLVTNFQTISLGFWIVPHVVPHLMCLSDSINGFSNDSFRVLALTDSIHSF